MEITQRETDIPIKMPIHCFHFVFKDQGGGVLVTQSGTIQVITLIFYMALDNAVCSIYWGFPMFQGLICKG